MKARLDLRHLDVDPEAFMQAKLDTEILKCVRGPPREGTAKAFLDSGTAERGDRQGVLSSGTTERGDR